MAGNRAKGATRAHKTGFVLPSQNEWIKAATTNRTAAAPTPTEVPDQPRRLRPGSVRRSENHHADPKNGDVTNAGTQPLATFRAEDATVPSWCPPFYSA